MIDIFHERDAYRIQLREAIKKHGIANLTPAIQRTIPTDLKTLYEIPWWMQPIVWFRIFQMSNIATRNELARSFNYGT